MRGVPWLLAALAVAGCTVDDATGPAEELSHASDSIVNGEEALGDPAVVALTIQNQTFCSATLITPSIVLTAAHCLPPHIPYAVSDIEVLFGTGPVVDELIPAHAAWSNPLWNDQNFDGDDVGLLQIKSIPAADPIPLNTTPVPNGSDVRLVGFGITGNGQTDSGTKREGIARVIGQSQFVLDLDRNPSVTCSGDSGGPTLLMNGSVAGIHSRSDCFFGSEDTRVDAYLTEIQTFIDSHPDPSCEADGLCATPCEGGDPDCPCAEDGQCTAACPDPNEDPDCMNACGPDGVCEADCPLVDPDCPTCGPDGQCLASCPADPDCAEPSCDPETECCDDECAEDGEPLEVEQGGCGCRVVGAAKLDTRAWLMLIAAVGLARRRRR
jgi:MYXO-CTERM domain-containing protein